jgi:hypothetical protein
MDSMDLAFPPSSREDGNTLPYERDREGGRERGSEGGEESAIDDTEREDREKNR